MYEDGNNNHFLVKYSHRVVQQKGYSVAWMSKRGTINRMTEVRNEDNSERNPCRARSEPIRATCRYSEPRMTENNREFPLEGSSVCRDYWR
jgi:hypothetical protein